MTDLPRLPSLDLTGQRCLVTGAGRGIGLAVAAGLAEAWAHVVLAARTEGEIAGASDAINAQGDSAEPLVLDAANIEGVQQAISQNGPFDILVNNAGTNRPKPMTEVSAEDYDAVLGLNLKSTFAKVKLGRLGTVEYLTGAVLYLASAASAPVTGTSLVADGGWTAE